MVGFSRDVDNYIRLEQSFPVLYDRDEHRMDMDQLHDDDIGNDIVHNAPGLDST